VPITALFHHILFLHVCFTRSCLAFYQVNFNEHHCAQRVVCLKRPCLHYCAVATLAMHMSLLVVMRLTACASQVIGPDQGDAYLKMKLKDQNKAMQILQESPSLQSLTQIQAPYVDLEVRGLPALQYFGNLVWQDAFKEQKGIISSHPSTL